MEMVNIQIIKIKIIVLTIFTALTSVYADTLVVQGDGDEGAIVSVDSSGSVTTIISGLAEDSYAVAYHTGLKKIFYGDGTTIKRANRDGTSPLTIISDTGSIVSDIDIDTQNDRIVYVLPELNQIKVADFNGDSVSTLYTDSSLHGIFVDNTNDYIYLTNSSGISRIDLIDGSNEVNLVTVASSFLTYLTVRSGKIFWTNFTQGRISSANLDGSGLSHIATTGITAPEGIDFSSTLSKLVYIGAPSAGSPLRSVATNGTSTVDIANINGYDVDTSYELPMGFGVKSTRMYFAVKDTTNNQSRIFWSNMSGDVVPVLSSAQIGSVTAIGYSKDQEKIYWGEKVNNTTSKIMTADADGSNISQWATVTGSVDDIKIDDKYGLLYIANTTQRRVQSLKLTNSSVLSTIYSVSNPLEIRPLLSLNDEYLFYWDKYDDGAGNGGYGVPRHRLYGALRSNTASAASVRTQYNNIHGFEAYASNRLVVSAGYFINSNLIIFNFAQNIGLESYSNTTPGVLGKQSLDSKVFPMPWGLYWGFKNEIHFGIPTSDPLVVKIITLEANEKLIGLTEVNLEAEFPNVVPDPTPPESKQGFNTVTGKIITHQISDEGEVFDSKVNRALVSGSLKGVSAYLIPTDITDNTLLGQSSSSVTTLDEDGYFNFINVPDGEYLLKILREDLISPGTLTISTDDEIPDFVVEQKNLADYDCTANDRTKLVLGIDRKIEKMVDSAQAFAQTAYDRVSNQSALLEEAVKLQDLHSDLVDSSQFLPRLQISCETSSECTEASYSDQIKNYSKAFKSLKAQIIKVLKMSGKASKVESIKKRSERILISIKKIPRSSYLCSYQEDSPDDVVVVD